MNARTNRIAALLAAAILTIPALAAAFTAPDPLPGPEYADSEQAERQAELYDEGTEAIDEERYEEAVRFFTKAAEIKGSRSDGAMYWAAYALGKMGRRTEALQVIDGLKKAYPSSRWLDDAKALELEVRQDRGDRVSPEAIDDVELKIIAIQSLMHTDPEKAFPLLEKIVKGPSHQKVKERALFILSQSSSPRARTLMAEMARGKSNPDLQTKAVRYLGISGGEQNRQLLSDIYASGVSNEVKEDILKAFMIMGDRGRILQAAKSESDADLREEAIRLLGVMGARADLAAMYSSETSRSVREEIIHAMFIAADADKLAEIAKAEKDVELRTEAIRNLGLIGKKTAPFLLSLYAGDSDSRIKEAVIHGLFVQGSARALIDLSKKETNRELKQEIVQKLSIMNDDEAVQYMLQILEQ